MNGICSALLLSIAVAAAEPTVQPDKPYAVDFPAAEAKFVRVAIHLSTGGQPCFDELEVYGPDGKRNLALAPGAKASASSCLPGYAIHRIDHLNDGRYGNSHSWIAASQRNEWAQIELPRKANVAKVVLSRDREGVYRDRVVVQFEVLLSTDGKSWQSAAKIKAVAAPMAAKEQPRPLPRFGVEAAAITEAFQDGDLLRYAFLSEARSHQWLDASDPLKRVLDQTEAMLDRLAAKGIDVSSLRKLLVTESRRHHATLLAMEPPDLDAERHILLRARLAKRSLFFLDPDLLPLEKILFVKRQPFRPSHNYSVNFDAQGGPGGAVCCLEIPSRHGRLEPDQATVKRLFEAGDGIARNPAASFDARRIYFGYRRSMDDYYHLMVMNAEGNQAEQLTDGPFHDYWPCPLPDGGISFISTRCKARFLCWRPQAFVLFRMDSDGRNIRPLSHANISEWAPSTMRDGRILWMRSEYLDKGADFGHTLWAIRPDGTYPELIFGNNTRNCYANGRQVPDSNEISCTLVSHGGDLNGPIALIDPTKGRFNPQAITNITPDVQPHYHMSWAQRACFRDPIPIGRDHILCSHAPDDRFGLYVIDRYGNREMLHFDPTISSMCPTLLQPTIRPPNVPAAPAEETIAMPDESSWGQLMVADVYRGLEPSVKRGSVKYLRICQEIRADLIALPDGSYQQDHEPFQDWYATPIHKVSGPNGWPTYVAKATWGIVPVEADGSANFMAPADKVLYFQALDKDYNELQRMRSVVQLQRGEKRTCIGCHEHRASAPPVRHGIALRREPSRPDEPPWGAGPFDYHKVVQPVWDAKCIECHNGSKQDPINLTGTPDAEKVPASYRTLIQQGWVHYFDCQWGREHAKAPPRSFGTLHSRLWKVLDAGHHDVALTSAEARAVKCWIDLNCPLWSRYQLRADRKAVANR